MFFFFFKCRKSVTPRQPTRLTTINAAEINKRQYLFENNLPRINLIKLSFYSLWLLIDFSSVCCSLSRSLSGVGLHPKTQRKRHRNSKSEWKLWMPSESLSWVNRPKVKLIIWIKLIVWNWQNMRVTDERSTDDLDLYCQKMFTYSFI